MAITTGDVLGLVTTTEDGWVLTIIAGDGPAGLTITAGDRQPGLTITPGDTRGLATSTGDGPTLTVGATTVDGVAIGSAPVFVMTLLQDLSRARLTTEVSDALSTAGNNVLRSPLSERAVTYTCCLLPGCFSSTLKMEAAAPATGAAGQIKNKSVSLILQAATLSVGPAATGAPGIGTAEAAAFSVGTAATGAPTVGKVAAAAFSVGTAAAAALSVGTAAAAAVLTCTLAVSS